MDTQDLIHIDTLCTHYEIEFTFFNQLKQYGLIDLTCIDQQHFLPKDQLSLLEKMIRLHHELEVNLEGVDIIVNLLAKIDALEAELTSVKNSLRRHMP